MCHFRRIYHFFAIWFQNFFWALTVIKDFFSKTCKTPKTAENRGTMKTKVVELSTHRARHFDKKCFFGNFFTFFFKF